MIAATDFPENLVLIGAGKMGGSLLESWLALGFPGTKAVVMDPHPALAITALCEKTGVILNPPTLPFTPAVIVLAIKPQMLEESAGLINTLIGPESVVVSILAGKTIENLSHYLPKAQAIVRTMPNLPASIRQGATGAFANAHTSAKQKQQIDSLLKASGLVEWLDTENLIDAVTAISGSGPAYIFYMAECLAAAGLALGLPKDLAERLAQSTVTGAAALMEQSALDPATLRQNVTSPGGTTAAALKVLMAEDGLSRLLCQATEAAKQRAEELAG